MLPAVLAQTGIALIEQAGVSIVRVDHAPLIGVFEFSIPEPDERIKALPVASSLRCRLLNFQSAEHYL